MVEHKFDRFRWPRIAARIKLEGKREKRVAFLRYVGDVLGISFWFCPACLEQLIDEIYRDTVCFDVSNDGLCSLDNLNGVKLRLFKV